MVGSDTYFWVHSKFEFQDNPYYPTLHQHSAFPGIYWASVVITTIAQVLTSLPLLLLMESFHVIFMELYFRYLTKKRIRRPVQSVFRFQGLKQRFMNRNISIKRSLTIGLMLQSFHCTALQGGDKSTSERFESCWASDQAIIYFNKASRYSGT